MIKGLLRFAIIWGVSMLLTPYLNRFFESLASRTASIGFLRETFEALRTEYLSTLIRSFGESMGDMAFGPVAKSKSRK